MCFVAGRITVKWPFRWTATTESHSSSVMLKIIRSFRIPAQQTTMWRSPNVFSAASTIACPPAMVATLSAFATARPPLWFLARDYSSSIPGAQRGAPLDSEMNLMFPIETMEASEAEDMRYQLTPIFTRPWLLNGLSRRLIESHYENHYGGALRRLNA